MTITVRAGSWRAFPVVLLVALLAPSAAATSTAPCTGVDTSLTEDRKQQYAQLVAAAVGKGVEPEQVVISKYMQSGIWSAVYASTPETDDGVLFFEATGGQPRFKDVWGGMADASAMPRLIAWATNIGAPEALAQCFAETVTG